MTANQLTKLTNKRIKQIYWILDKLKIKPIYIEEITESQNIAINVINEALTHTSANAYINHEKLEFLGDAVLRLLATEFIDNKYPYMTVGERSELRSQLVSDKWLTKVGDDIGIEKVLITGTKASKDSSAIDTLQAEATEALIGALYESLNNLEPIHDWLRPYWIEESEKVLADPHKNNSKSALQEWSQRESFSLPEYEVDEMSKKHGNSKRFFCKVKIQGKQVAEGWGKSRKEAEKSAAQSALECIKNETIKMPKK